MAAIESDQEFLHAIALWPDHCVIAYKSAELDRVISVAGINKTPETTQADKLELHVFLPLLTLSDPDSLFMGR